MRILVKGMPLAKLISEFQGFEKDCNIKVDAHCCTAQKILK
jgi:hypothetical protein